MAFFRKRSHPEVALPEGVEPAEPGVADVFQELVSRREQDLRALGEIYYQSAGGGKPDTRALHRKVREIQRLDAQLELVPVARPVASGHRPTRVAAPTVPRGRQCACGALLHPTDRFCSTCGQPTDYRGGDRRCLSCKIPLDGGARFCRFCGVSTTAGGRVRVRHPLTGQEASFDFQAAPVEAGPRVPTLPPPSAQSQAYEMDDEDDEAASEGGDPSRQWIRELERFARPAQVDGQQLLQRGRDFLTTGRFLEAASEFEAVLALNPREGRAQYFLGVARYKNGELEPAIEAFERAIRMDRNNPDTHNDLGLCYARQSLWREAMDHYTRALAINPGHSDAHYNLAHLFIHQDVYAEAIPHLRAYLQHSPRARDFKEVVDLIEQLEAACAAGRRL